MRNNTINIAAKTRELDVDSRLSIKLYYRMADTLLKQASMYRDENNIIDLYILLLRFSSLVTETIPKHRDYHLYGEAKLEYKRVATVSLHGYREKRLYPPFTAAKLMQILSELEVLKPEVLKQVERINSACRKALSSSYNNPTYDLDATWPNYTRSQSFFNGNTQKENAQSGISSRRDFLNRPANTETPVFNPRYIEDRVSTLSLSIPRAKDETLSRHSFLTPANQSAHRSPVTPFTVQYPSYIDASPVELPSLQQGTTPQVATTSTVSPLRSNDRARWPESDDTVYTTDPNLLSLIRQPSPPPVITPLQTLSATVNVERHIHPQLQPSQVADPRPGPARGSDEKYSETKGPKGLHISTKMMEEFLKLAKLNTQQNLETCGVLAGYLKKGVFSITTLIIPKQQSTSDSCQTLNEEEIFDTQDKRGLFQLGWIHTHPTQTCFMSSIDLHTHYSYQVMLPEAIAIVMAPTDTSRKFGIFRLSDPGGVRVLQNCQRRGFHPHEDPPEGGAIYEESSHVYMSPNQKFDVVDLR